MECTAVLGGQRISTPRRCGQATLNGHPNVPHAAGTQEKPRRKAREGIAKAAASALIGLARRICPSRRLLEDHTGCGVRSARRAPHFQHPPGKGSLPQGKDRPPAACCTRVPCVVPCSALSAEKRWKSKNAMPTRPDDMTTELRYPPAVFVLGVASSTWWIPRLGCQPTAGPAETFLSSAQCQDE
ncbi:hypothetical protein VTK26DRAFT_3310 [Humicola hyalothermophila]